ncbi:hypothetical protein FN846DRAFT_909756 [Sphaerosporella brunnea]|uniref:Hydrophobin n=1 Tax=Sphaerosporella brunnea TaxID=1250544 RepID=A0A5J5ENS6_9PEZI|nr:hypothetical protein FN846DRAFT_909756 [Sphaerosporella brunnea]
MKFSSALVVLTAAVAVAAPAPTGGSCNSGKVIACCQSGLLGVLTCLVGICSLGGSTVCCDLDQQGLINIGTCVAL